MSALLTALNDNVYLVLLFFKSGTTKSDNRNKSVNDSKKKNKKERRTYNMFEEIMSCTKSYILGKVISL